MSNLQLQPFEPMLAELSARGFYFGVDTWLRLHRWIALQAGKPAGEVSSEKIRFSLSAIVCRTEEQQAIFNEVFEHHFKENKILIPQPETTGTPKKADEHTEPEPAGPAAQTPPVTEPPLPPRQVASSRKGPIRIELRFPENELRAWNHEPMDRAMQPLREKEWTDTYDWDIPGSIRRTIKSGGIPQFVFQQRKKSPAYLVLIEQRSARDHLARFYQEMVLELNRRDLDADAYFFDSSPHLVWKERDSIHRRIPIERLAGEFSEARLLIIGPAEPLLALPELRPSNLALDMRENWPRMALLCSTPVPDWGMHELALCQLFPVVPATAEGLLSLLPQWNAVQALTPHFWMMKYPEPSLPNLKFRGRKVPPEIITNLRRYLGTGGFRWLCATAYYPELYFELTSLFNDEAIAPQTDFSEWEQNHVWWAGLNRLCRLPWFRSGRLPNVFREALRELLPEEDAQMVRQQILAVLSLPDNQAAPGSYAETGRAFTLAWLEAEQAGGNIEAFLPTEISLADVEDAVGRKIWQRQTMAPLPEPDGSFRILWATGGEGWPNLEDQWNERMGTISRKANSVNEAVLKLKSEHFYLVIAEPGFENLAGLMKQMGEEGLQTTVILFDEKEETKGPPPQGVEQVYRTSERLQAFVGGMMQELTGTGSSSYGDYGNVGQEQTAYQQNTIPDLALQGFIDLVKKAKDFRETAGFYDRMKLEDVEPDLDFFNEMMAKTSSPEEVYTVLGYMKSKQIQPNERTFKIRIEKAESLSNAQKIFEEMRGENVPPTNDIATSLLEKTENFEQARSVLNFVREAGTLPPSLETYTVLLKKTTKFDDAASVFRELESAGIQPDKIAYTVYMSKAISYENARPIFDEMKKEGIETDAVTYTTLLDKAENFRQSRSTFEAMLSENIKPNRGMYTQVMKRAETEEDAKWVDAQMRKAGIGEGTIERVREQFKPAKAASPDDLQGLKRQLKEKVVEGVEEALKSIKEALAPDTEKMNSLILLESQFQNTKRQVTQGTISEANSQLEINRIRSGLLSLIDELSLRDLKGKENAESTKKTGFLLATLPTDMQVGREEKLIVRIASDEKILRTDFDTTDEHKILPLRVSEIMRVEWTDPEEENFQIRTYSTLEQIVEEDEFTEWTFRVTPQKAGSFPLVLKVTSIEMTDGKEQKKTEVFEENIEVREAPSASQSSYRSFK